MRISKSKYFVAAVVAAVAAALILWHLPAKKQSDTADVVVPVHPPCVVRTFPAADYLPPKVRAARIQALSSMLIRPYAFLSPSITDYSGCIKALRDLPAELTSEQFELLRDAIAVPFDTRMYYSPLEFNGLRNAAADFLLRQPGFPPDLLQDFAGMYEDPAQDSLWRDYCLQMLVAGWQNLGERGDDNSDEARALAVRVLEGAAGTRDHTWPGTALLGLRVISENDPAAFPPGKTDRLILDALTDRSASEALRITALRLAAERRLTESHAEAEALARDPAATPMLRLCAVATLGDLGTGNDLLAELATDHNPALSATAGKALRKAEKFTEK